MRKSQVKKSIIVQFFAILLLGVSLSACCAPRASEVTKSPAKINLNDIAPFPEANPGYTRYVVNVPPRNNEANYRIELLIGKNMQVDCNTHKLAGSVKQVELQGWGYYYYLVDNTGANDNNGISTLMACPTEATKTEFVTLNHNLSWLAYNSKLPIVVYAPSDLQVKYRIWSADEKNMSAVVE